MCPIGPTLDPHKISLIDHAFSSYGPIRSFADLGGVGQIAGAYMFYTLWRFPDIERALLIDRYIDDETRRIAREHPRCELWHSWFHNSDAVSALKDIEAIFLSNVLLHQVAPDWDALLPMVAARARLALIVNPQWIATDHTIRLLDLGPDEYVKNQPHPREYCQGLLDRPGELNPPEGRPFRNSVTFWQWGITDADLLCVMGALDFECAEQRNYGRFEPLANVEKHGFIFLRRCPSDLPDPSYSSDSSSEISHV